MRNYWILKAIKALLDAMPEWECKTIGNGHPGAMHCIACSLYDIRKCVKAHIDFWEDGERYKRAIS